MLKSFNLKGIHGYLYLLLEALRDYQKCQFLQTNIYKPLILIADLFMKHLLY